MLKKLRKEFDRIAGDNEFTHCPKCNESFEEAVELTFCAHCGWALPTLATQLSIASESNYLDQGGLNLHIGGIRSLPMTASEFYVLANMLALSPDSMSNLINLAIEIKIGLRDDTPITYSKATMVPGPTVLLSGQGGPIGDAHIDLQTQVSTITNIGDETHGE